MATIQVHHGVAGEVIAAVLRDAAANPINLTGKTVTLNWRRRDARPVAATVTRTATIGVAAAGEVSYSTAGADFNVGVLDPGSESDLWWYVDPPPNGTTGRVPSRYYDLLQVSL